MDQSSLLPGAAWIGSSIAGDTNTSAPVPYVRKTFRLAQPAKSARLTVTALGLYECEINGHRVGDEIFAPGWTDYHRRAQYQTYDVTAQLRAGENTLGAILGDGWYCGFVAWTGREKYGKRPCFIARLEVVLEDGSKVEIVSDGSWKTATGPILDADLLMGETYDARRELTGWSEPGYDDSQWASVVTQSPDPIPEIDPRIGPPVRRIQEIKPVTFNTETGIHDLGQNFTGRVRLKVRAGRDRVVRLRFAEILEPDGQLYLANLRKARATDFYTCKGAGEETWEPRFTFHGFRYVEVSGLEKGEQAEITGIVLHSDTPPTGTFQCSHKLLNQLQHNITWGQKSNFLEVPTDCPQRDERLGWTGDAQVFCRTAAFNMDVQAFFHKWMRDARDAQTPLGGIPAVIPAVSCGEDADRDGGPAWDDAVIICPWTIYLCYGDRAILEENYETMRRFLDYIAAHQCLGKIRCHPDVVKWGGFGDWLAMDGATTSDFIGTAFYAYDVSLMERIATVLGRGQDAETYHKLRGEIIEAFRGRFVTSEGTLTPETQTTYVLALHFGLLPEAIRASAAARLARFVKERGDHLSTGFVGTPYLLQVLEDAGHIDVAYRLLEEKTFPSWLFPVLNGATTIWERWDGWTPEKGPQDPGMNSYNHYAYGAVGAWMYATVAGLELDPAEPGYRHIVFRPRPGGTITWAEATLKTPHGPTRIRWDLEGEKLKVQFAVPPGAHATFSPPPGYGASASTYGPGKHELSLKKSA